VTLEFKNSNESPLIICRFNVIVTCNSRLTVHLEGDIEAWRRRVAIVEYHKEKPKQVIADLDRQILEKEASGVLNWMIEGLDKIHADDWQLNLSSGQQAVVDNLLLESDSHNLFVREALIRADGKQLTVQDCFAAYVEFCSERGWATRQNISSVETLAMLSRAPMDSRCDTTSKMPAARHNAVGKDCNFAIGAPRSPGDPVKTALKCLNSQFSDESDTFLPLCWGNFHEHTSLL
jgi:hypothetical protein